MPGGSIMTFQSFCKLCGHVRGCYVNMASVTCVSAPVPMHLEPVFLRGMMGFTETAILDQLKWAFVLFFALIALNMVCSIGLSPSWWRLFIDNRCVLSPTVAKAFISVLLCKRWYGGPEVSRWQALLKSYPDMVTLWDFMSDRFVARVLTFGPAHCQHVVLSHGCWRIFSQSLRVLNTQLTFSFYVDFAFLLVSQQACVWVFFCQFSVGCHMRKYATVK